MIDIKRNKMNERILELADKAVEDISSGPWNISDEFCKKFAELIVRECAGICETHGWGMLEHGMSGHNIADDCGTLIKEHFGVEQ